MRASEQTVPATTRKLRAYRNAKDRTMAKNAEYLARMEMQLRKWDADVDALVAARKKAGALARGAQYARMKALRASRSVGEHTFQQMRAADPVDPQMYVHMQAAWESMQAAYERACAPPMT